MKVRRIPLQKFHRARETESWRAQTKLCPSRPEKGAVTSEDIEPNLPMSAWASPVEAWVDSDLPRGQGHGLQQS